MSKANSAKGTALNEYRSIAADTKSDAARVSVWHDRIKTAQISLRLGERIKKAERGDEYLHGKATTKNAKTIYLRYLLPLLEEMHRKTIPSIPSPSVEAKTQATEMFEDKARSLIDLSFNSPYSNMETAANYVQWADDRFGIGFIKTVWEVDYEPSSPAEPKDVEQIAIEVERAWAENDNPQDANITEQDLDYVHAMIHAEALQQTGPMDPRFQQLLVHLQETEARLTMIKRERPVCRTVATDRFAYDDSVPWELRAWEAEKCCERLADLRKMGCKNLNPGNLKAKAPKGRVQATFDELVGEVWKIHDRRTGQHLMIAAEGRKDGEFLKKEDWSYGPIDIYRPFVTRPTGNNRKHGESNIDACIPILDELAIVDFSIQRHVENHSDYKVFVPKGTPDYVKSGLNNPNQKFVEIPPDMFGKVQDYAPPPIPVTLQDQRDSLLGELRRELGIDAQDTGTPNPHQITATESNYRGQARAAKQSDRQKIMGIWLAGIARNFLGLYRKFATQDILVKTIGPEGPMYPQINPADIPEDLDIYLDVQGETDEGRQERMANVQAWAMFHLGLDLPTDAQKLSEFVGRAFGIKRPEQFRMAMPEGPGDQMAMPQQQAVPTQQGGNFSPASKPAKETPNASIGKGRRTNAV